MDRIRRTRRTTTGRVRRRVPPPITVPIVERAPSVIDVTTVARGPGSIIDRLRPTVPRRPTLLIRPDDLVVLEVDWVNMHKRKTGSGPVLRRNSTEGDAYLIVGFPPLNLAEESYFETAAGMEEPDDPVGGSETPDPPPIDALIADESRLVFKVPAGYTVKYTIAGILQACTELEMSVPANALPPRRRILVTPFFPTDRLVAANVGDSRFGSIIAASRARTAVRARTGLSAEYSEIVAGLIDDDLLVEPARRGGTGEIIGSAGVIGVGRPGFGIIDTGLLRIRPRPAEPSATQTALETPFRLIVSPNKFGAWAHATEPVEHNERIELWHSRLGVRGADGEVDELSSFNRTIRAVWARGRFDTNPNPDPPIPAYDPSTSFEFRMSLDDFDRHNIVHLSSNFGINLGGRFYEPEAVDVERLMLTSLGSWMDVQGTWNPGPVPGMSVEEWIHRGTVGRDHYVRVVYQGFLVPFGHRASLVKITERKFHDHLPGRTAYLRQRMFIVVKEPEKVYNNSSFTFDGSKNLLRGMPLRSVRITSLVTPDLNEPSLSDVEVAGSFQSRKAFWPKVGAAPYRFTFLATDLGGRVLEFTAPLIWVDKSLLDTSAASRVADLDTAYTATGGPVPGGNKVGFAGQSVTFAPAGKPDDTSFDTATIGFGAEFIGPNPKFHPRIREAHLDLPAVKQLAGLSDHSVVSYDDTFLVHGFDTPGQNKGQLLFKSSSPVTVGFSDKSDRTGGLAAPSLKISGISRLLGPVSGDLAKAATGTFDPTSFFAGLNAKIFGVIDLIDILEELPFFNDLAKAPRFVGQVLNDVEAFLEDLERLEELIGDVPALWNHVDAEIQAVTNQIQALLGGSGNLDDLEDDLNDLATAITAAAAALDAAGLTQGLRQQVEDRLNAIGTVLANVATIVGLVEQFINGFELPTSLKTRFEWRPKIGGWPPGSTNNQIFRPQPNSLVLAVEGGVQNGSPAFNVSASLEDFELHLIAPATVIIIPFEKLQFRVEAGKKPEIDVVMDDIVFTGVLSFIQTIRELIPLDVFSDPPAVEVDASGITAGATLALPNISVGVFSLENLSLGAGFTIPFVGPPLSVWFSFCERESPALVSVSLFGGGFFFGVTLDPAGIRVLEAAIEFGANVSMDFGVASGGISVMAGIYFKLENNDEATLTGYFRARGHVRVLGIITVSIELYLELSYEFASDKCVGRAKLTIEIDLFLFSASVTIECEKKFAGANGDPTFAQVMSPYKLDPTDPTSPLVDPWEEYCVAFA